jgi:hypothetical protein
MRKIKGKRRGWPGWRKKTTGSFTSSMHVLKVYRSCSATKKKHFREQGANWTNELIRHFRSHCRKWQQAWVASFFASESVFPFLSWVLVQQIWGAEESGSHVTMCWRYWEGKVMEGAQPRMRSWTKWPLRSLSTLNIWSDLPCRKGRTRIGVNPHSGSLRQLNNLLSPTVLWGFPLLYLKPAASHEDG